MEVVFYFFFFFWCWIMFVLEIDFIKFISYFCLLCFACLFISRFEMTDVESPPTVEQSFTDCMYIRVLAFYREPKTFENKVTGYIFSGFKLHPEEYKTVQDQKSLTELIGQNAVSLVNAFKSPAIGVVLKLGPSATVSFEEGKVYDIKLKLKPYSFINEKNALLTGVSFIIQSAVAHE